MSAVDVFLIGVYVIEVIGTVGVIIWVVRELIKYVTNGDER